MNEQYPIQARWSPKITESGFSAVPTSFLRHYAELGISSTEAMLVIHIMARKWDARLPFPAVKTLANEMGLSASQVRARLSKLEKRGVIVRITRKGRSNRYDPTPLIKKLEAAISEYARRVEAEGDVSEVDPIDTEALYRAGSNLDG